MKLFLLSLSILSCQHTASLGWRESVNTMAKQNPYKSRFGVKCGYAAIATTFVISTIIAMSIACLICFTCDVSRGSYFFTGAIFTLLYGTGWFIHHYTSYQFTGTLICTAGIACILPSFFPEEAAGISLISVFLAALPVWAVTGNGPRMH